MNLQLIRYAVAVLVAVGVVQSASAQSVIVLNPAAIGPYSRTALNPYLGPASRVGDPFDFRNQLLQPLAELQGFMAGVDSVSGRFGTAAPANYDEWIKRREGETRFSPSGQPIGYGVYTPYYDLPSQGAFIPTTINRGRVGR